MSELSYLFHLNFGLHLGETLRLGWELRASLSCLATIAIPVNKSLFLYCDIIKASYNIGYSVASILNPKILLEDSL